jgi:hypothetical protein
MTAQLNTIAAAQHQTDLYEAAALSRRARSASRPKGSRRSTRRFPQLRRRPAVA